MRNHIRKIKSDISNRLDRSQFDRSIEQIIDLIFPPQPLWPQDNTGLRITFIDQPQCYSCGVPFAYDMGKGTLCGNCIASPPQYDHARAAFAYDEISRGPILSFKHGGHTEGVSTFAAQMSRAGRDILDGADYLIPVPLHARRLRQRQFNQAALLARALSRRVNIPSKSHILLRVKATQSQGGKSLSGRRRNVAGAFAVSHKTCEIIKGKNLVLIDDVMTTGATLNSCAATLKKAGAARVDALTLARVLKSDGALRPT